jgi:HD-GYP domain-containing protein (c-di-GMP phosphodiesterase class II)
MLQVLAQGEKGFSEVDQGCSEVGSRIAARLGMAEGTQLALYHICERWNGKGPHKLKGDEIPLPARIVNVAMILEVFFSERGMAAAGGAARARRGKSFDPSVADAAAGLCEEAEFWSSVSGEEPWNSVLELEPQPVRNVDESSLDDVAFALADITDLKSSEVAAHSRRTAELAEAIAKRLELGADDIALTRRAALVHDVGLVAVPSLLLEDGAAWSEADFERFRLHTYYTERILARSEPLQEIGAVASAHHENVDGSGYHRNLVSSQLSVPARVVAVAAAFVDLQGVHPDAGAAELLRDLETRRNLDAECMAALAAETGSAAQRSPVRREWPAGLTEREVEVLQLVASGLNLKQAATRLVISNHTARHHLESVYSKAGVSSRAGATLFAVENGLLR